MKLGFTAKEISRSALGLCNIMLRLRVCRLMRLRLSPSIYSSLITSSSKSGLGVVVVVSNKAFAMR